MVFLQAVPAAFEAERQVARHASLEHPRLLTNETDRVALHLARRDVAAAVAEALPCGRFLQESEDPQKGRLARAVLADDRNLLSGIEAETIDLEAKALRILETESLYVKQCQAALPPVGSPG